MKKELTYSEAFEKLKKLVEQLEEGDIQLEQLTEKAKQVNELILICETKLRSIDEEINDATKIETTRPK